MLVMRRLITDQFLMSHSRAAVGGCGKVGRPRHYLTQFLGGGKAEMKGRGRWLLLRHNSAVTEMTPRASFQSSEKHHVCRFYDR